MEPCSPSGRCTRDAALDARHQQVAQADVGEGAAHHDLVVAAACAVGVEVLRLHALLDQVARRRAALGDVAGGGDVIGRDRVAEQRQHARAVHVRQRRRRHGHALEVGRVLHVGGFLVPAVEVARGHLDVGPVVIALEHAARSCCGTSASRSSASAAPGPPHRSARCRRDTPACRPCRCRAARVVRSMSSVPASAYATTSGGEARKFMRTSGCTRPSKLRLPESTAQAVRSPAFDGGGDLGLQGAANCRCSCGRTRPPRRTRAAR